MKAYKGFHKTADGLKCRDKIYLPGETYTEDEAELCRIGMHACLAPIDVFTYYPPATSVYHVVEVGDDAAESDEESDSKVVTSRARTPSLTPTGIRPGLAGALGSGLTLAERSDDGTLLGIVAVIVGREYDGQTIEPGVWYTLRGGRVVKA